MAVPYTAEYLLYSKTKSMMTFFFDFWLGQNLISLL